MSGRTPVPCTMCNNYLKWPLLEKVANERGIYHLAMGHYVNKEKINGYWHITSGCDHDKDQSFFLWGLPQHILERMLLPMGKLTKTEVREYAQRRGFLKTANKKDSVGVCFCPMDYRSFLRDNVDSDLISHGRFIHEDGSLLGEHQGFPFYTIGQRRGLGIYLNRTIFVKEIIPEENKVVLTYHLSSLEKTEIWLTEWNIINQSDTLGHDDVIIKIRYRKQANRCTISITDNNQLHVQLYEPLTSIANGQAAAFYRGKTVLGGGIIVRSQ